jgi:hypothetical protein
MVACRGDGAASQPQTQAQTDAGPGLDAPGTDAGCAVDSSALDGAQVALGQQIVGARNTSKSRANQRERAGFEPSESVEFTTIHVDSRTNDPPRVDVSARELVAFGPMKMGDFGSVEDALARAIAQAFIGKTRHSTSATAMQPSSTRRAIP